ncbi:MAG: coiled-coil domain-containing protein [Planctomycetota bacterium]|jgi:hypothetical protein
MAMKSLKLLLIMLLFAAPVQGQSASKTLERIARDQQNIKQRLERINEKMQRLVRKNELEGKQHTADLIRRANAELERRSIVKRIEDLDEKIRAAQLTVDEEQVVLLKDLEDIFAILQDRNDLERVQDLIASMIEGIERIDRLIEEQDGILKETRELIYDESSLLDANLKRVKEIIEDQEALKASTKPAAEQSIEARKVMALAEELQALAGQEESLAEEASRPVASSQEDEQREESARAQEALSDRLAEARKKLEEARDWDIEEGTPDKREARMTRAEQETEAAEEAMTAAQEHFKEGRLAEASEQSAQASEKLREAAKALSEQARAARRDEMRTGFNLAGRQDYIEKKTAELRDKMEVLKSVQEQSDSKHPLSPERAEEIMNEMNQSQNSLKEGEHGRALSHQNEALDKLEALEKAMEQAREQARERSDASQHQANDAARSEKMQELAKRQKTLEEQTHDLMRRLREIPDPQMRKDLSDAADNMAGASAALGEGNPEEAEMDEEEAKKQLEKAMKKLVQEETKYQNIRQQEVLFRVQQALEEVKTEQDAITSETAEFDTARAGVRRLTRLQRKTLRTLAVREQEVRAKTSDIKEKIEEDDATVFSWVLERNVQDLDEVAEHLQRQRSDPLVQNIQRDISDRFAELIEAMKLELKRRSEAEPQEGAAPDDSGPQRNALIPPVAELLMIKKMEENALRRLNDFVRLNPEILEEGAGIMEMEMLKRLGHRHAHITELFTKMVEKAGGGPQGPGAPETSEEGQ